MEAQTKKIILTAIASVAGVLLLAAAGWLLYFSSQFATYQDYKFKFSIKYPKAWQVVKNPQEHVAVVFVSPKENALDTVQENFNVTVQPVPAHLASLSTFSQTIQRQMTAVFKSNIHIVEDKPLRWGVRQGHLMAFDAPQPDHLKTVVAWLIKGDYAYILTFLGAMNQYQKYEPLANEMIHSFELE